MLTIRYSLTDTDGTTGDHEIVIGDPVKSDNLHGDYKCDIHYDGAPQGRGIMGVTPFDAVQNAIGVAKAYTMSPKIAQVVWR